jgi:hypothetical protein
MMNKWKQVFDLQEPHFENDVELMKNGENMSQFFFVIAPSSERKPENELSQMHFQQQS